MSRRIREVHDLMFSWAKCSNSNSSDRAEFYFDMIVIDRNRENICSDVLENLRTEYGNKADFQELQVAATIASMLALHPQDEGSLFRQLFFYNLKELLQDKKRHKTHVFLNGTILGLLKASIVLAEYKDTFDVMESDIWEMIFITAEMFDIRDPDRMYHTSFKETGRFSSLLAEHLTPKENLLVFSRWQKMGKSLKTFVESLQEDKKLLSSFPEDGAVRTIVNEITYKFFGKSASLTQRVMVTIGLIDDINKQDTEDVHGNS